MRNMNFRRWRHKSVFRQITHEIADILNNFFSESLILFVLGHIIKLKYNISQM